MSDATSWPVVSRVKIRERILEFRVHPDVQARAQQAYIDSLMYGRGFAEAARKNEIAITKFRPKLP